ncbi:MAG: hypothetical protein HN855_01615, partial [Anaerolineae bacterium]|nr:hypothetical protein [Anaerolineae bacterium]
MDVIRDRLNDPLVAGIVGLVVGLLFGWIVIGWLLWPVTWTDAAPVDLQGTWREDYMRMMVDSYTLIPDVDLANMRWQGLGDQASQALNMVAANPGPRNPESIQVFGQVVGSSTV